ncbi:MAG: hypothetical protein VB085_08745 [Peptococcaceae bacterium]|nr:hypothetical protein [Peptococcaceae bacterium]
MEWIFQLAVTTALGALAWFVKGTFARIEAGQQKTAAEIQQGLKDTNTRIEAVQKASADRMVSLEKELAQLKADLPMVYTLREDFIRSMNSVESGMKHINDKLDTLLQRSGRREIDG